MAIIWLVRNHPVGTSPDFWFRDYRTEGVFCKLFMLLLFLLYYAHATVILISARLPIQLRGASCPDESAREWGLEKDYIYKYVGLLSGTAWYFVSHLYSWCLPRLKTLSSQKGRLSKRTPEMFKIRYLHPCQFSQNFRRTSLQENPSSLSLALMEGTSRLGTTGSTHMNGNNKEITDAIGRWLNQPLQEDPFSVLRAFPAGGKVEPAAGSERKWWKR